MLSRCCVNNYVVVSLIVMSWSCWFLVNKSFLGYIHFYREWYLNVKKRIPIFTSRGYWSMSMVNFMWLQYVGPNYLIGYAGIKVKPIFEKVTYILKEITYITYENLYFHFALKTLIMLHYLLFVRRCLCQITFSFYPPLGNMWICKWFLVEHLLYFFSQCESEWFSV